MEAVQSASKSKMECSKEGEDTFENVCSPCRKKNKNNLSEGNLFCMHCQDYYCSRCVTVHNDIPAISDHNIILISVAKKVGGVHLPLERCNIHNTQVVDIYCTIHRVVACRICMALGHKSCKLQYVPNSVNSIKKYFTIGAVILECSKARQAANRGVQLNQSSLGKLQIRKEYALNELKTFKNEIVSWLDEIEKITIEHLEMECGVLESKWTTDVEFLKKCIEDMEQYQTKMDCSLQNQSQNLVCACLGSEVAAATVKQLPENWSYLSDVIFTPSDLQMLMKSQNVLGKFTMKYEQMKFSACVTDPLRRKALLMDDLDEGVTDQQPQLYMQSQYMGNLPICGIECAELMSVGARVVPGNDWNEEVSALVYFKKFKHYRHHNIGSRVGTVKTVPPSTQTGWIEVTWDNGNTYLYKMGCDNQYDIGFIVIAK